MLPIDQLFAAYTAEGIRDQIYEVAKAVGYSVTSWRPGAFSRTLIFMVSRVIAPMTDFGVRIAKSGFLDYAEGDMLGVVAKQVYNVDVVEASFADGFVTLTNASGSPHGPFDPGDIVVSNSATGKSYYNTETITIGASSALIAAFAAYEIGADSTAVPGAIDTLETTLIGVTVANTAPLIGQDLEAAENVRTRCRAKLDSLSPNGSAKAYDYVARTPSLVSGRVITRTQVIAESDTGDVTIYLADDDGAVSSGVADDVEAGILRWCTPQCIEPEAVSATQGTYSPTIHVYVDTTSGLSEATIEARTLAALTAFFRLTPLGGREQVFGSGYLYTDAIEDYVARALPESWRVTIEGTSEIPVPVGFVTTLGVATITVHLTEEP